VVIGGGAIGLLVAGKLAQAGEAVALLARRAAAEASARYGLRIAQGGSVGATPPIPAAAEAEALPAAFQRPELAVLCVKSYDTAGALPALLALRPAHTLTLQNGIGNEERLAETLGAAQVLSGAITSSVTTQPAETGPTLVAVTKRGGIGVAPVHAEGSPAAARAASLLSAAGFALRGYEDYRALKWSKALLNMLGNATAAILDTPVDEVYADGRLVALERRAFMEALAVMRRLGIRPLNLPRYPAALLALAMRLPPPLLYPILRRAVAGGRGGKEPSLLGDLRRGSKHSEGEVLYGAVAHAAGQAGVAAPVNAALWRTLQAVASGAEPWERYRHKPDELLSVVSSQ
jgi:2-dehydropantoate 2-reductase